MRRTVLILMGAWSLASYASAAHVVPMDVRTLSDHAAQAFVGEVVSVRSYWAEDPRRIESEVVFADVDYLKGAPDGGDAIDTRTLIVPGGRVGDMQMRVCCAPEFAPGQRWMLFVLPSYKTFPVVGLYQGAFRIRTDKKGVARVYDSEETPVREIDAQGFVQAARDVRHATPVPVKASANLAVMSAAGPEQTSAMSYDAFIQQVQPVLQASHSHASPETAGRPVPITHRAVPLKAVKTAPAETSVKLRSTPQPVGNATRKGGAQ